MVLLRLFAWVIALSAAAVAPAWSQDIWLAPHAPGPFPGHSDWNDVFKPDAPWQTAASHIKILILADGTIDKLSDAELTAISDFLKAHGAQLGIGTNAITKIPGEGCGGMEGYGLPQWEEDIVARLSRLGVQLGYVETDGPVWFGHYATDPQACRLPIEKVVQRTAPTVRGILKYYPNAIYGDVEGSVLTAQPQWQETYDTYRKLMEQETGHRIDALEADVSWPLPSWPTQLAELYRYTHAAGMRFGVVYNGDGTDQTDAAWMAHAENNFTRIEGEMGIKPDEAILASWNDHPDRFLPETSPTALSHLVLSYLRPRTRFVLTKTPGAIVGKLVGEDGHGVPSATVRLQSLGLAANQLPPEESISGTVPAGAKAAVFAFGINYRPDIAGDNDVVAGDFLYAESGTGSAKVPINVPLKVQADGNPHPGGIEVAQVGQIAGQPLVRLVVHANQSYHFNSPRFAVDGGAPFSLTGRIASETALGLFGGIDIVWFDAEGHDKWRSTLHVDQTINDVAKAVTDKDGAFRLAAPKDIPGGGFRLVYSGDDTLRGAYADLPR
jgi:hypothetical protein